VYVTQPAGTGNSAADYSIDGRQAIRISMNDGGQNVYNVVAFSTGALPFGDHILIVTNRGSDEFRLDRIIYNSEDDGSDTPATPGVPAAQPAPPPVAPPPVAPTPVVPPPTNNPTATGVVQQTSTIVTTATQTQTTSQVHGSSNPTVMTNFSFVTLGSGVVTVVGPGDAGPSSELGGLSMRK